MQLNINPTCHLFQVVSQYIFRIVGTDLLTMTIKSYPHVILESVSRLREAFDYLMLLPLTTADGLLRSIQPLLKLSPTLRDGLVIVLRKAIFSRFILLIFMVLFFYISKNFLLNLQQNV